MAKTYNLFISHSWNYTDAYEKLCNLLDAAPYFSYRNYSVPKDDPVQDANKDAELYQAIKRQISPCHIVIIMAGKYSTFSKWIKKEIKIAKEEFSEEKPILAVKPWANTQVSTTVAENSDKLVGWNTNSIVSTIRELAL
jgi:hypothetical protein